jgi:hypothetical protein
MDLEKLRSRLDALGDPLETQSRVDAHNTREILEALGARVPLVFQVNSRPRIRRKCRLCNRTSRCQECRKTQREWNDMQAALDAIKNGTDHGTLLSLDQIMSSNCDES